MTDPEKQTHKLSVVNDGRMAELAAQHFGTLIQEEKTALMGKLTGEFRQGKVEPILMASHVAAMVVLENLESRIKRSIVRGRETEKGIIENAGTNTEPAHS